MNAPAAEVIERELPGNIDTGVLAVISKAEIDVQIATAHRFPRSVKAFRDEALAMVTLTEAIAEECIYALPRDGKTIEGPSARFAEVIASARGAIAAPAPAWSTTRATSSPRRACSTTCRRTSPSRTR
jgi:hypothetical protein